MANKTRETLKSTPKENGGADIYEDVVPVQEASISRDGIISDHHQGDATTAEEVNARIGVRIDHLAGEFFPELDTSVVKMAISNFISSNLEPTPRSGKSISPLRDANGEMKKPIEIKSMLEVLEKDNIENIDFSDMVKPG